MEENYGTFLYLFFYISSNPTAFGIAIYLVWEKIMGEWEETNSNEQGPESRISVTSYTPVYEYTVNGQRYEYHTRLGTSTDQYPIGKECPGYYNPKNPADVTETLKEITGGGSHFLSLLFFGIGVLAILFALIRVWAVITLI